MPSPAAPPDQATSTAADEEDEPVEKGDKRGFACIDGRLEVSMEYYDEMLNRSLELKDELTAEQAMKNLVQHFGRFHSDGEKKALCRVVRHIVYSTGIKFVKGSGQR